MLVSKQFSFNSGLTPENPILGAYFYLSFAFIYLYCLVSKISIKALWDISFIKYQNIGPVSLQLYDNDFWKENISSSFFHKIDFHCLLFFFVSITICYQFRHLEILELKAQCNFCKVSLFRINVLKCMCFQSSLTVFWACVFPPFFFP